MHLIREYINYIRKAQGRHQIHSPFVYDFLDKCLKTKISTDSTHKIKELISNIQKNKSIIFTNDFGAGSKKMKNQRTVAETYKNASCKGSYAKLLYQLSIHYKPKTILELGTNLGVGTFHLHEGNPDAEIVSIDGCIETQAIAKQNLQSENILFITNTFDEALNNLTPITFDLIYIDGDHRGESLIRYLRKLKEFSHNETIFVLDDIRWSENMFGAWEKLKNSSEYHLSMDLFKMGILIPKKGKEKEHFFIRLKKVLTSL